MSSRPREPFIDYVDILYGRTALEATYAAEIPAIRTTKRLNLHPKATYFVGENGSGKSTLLEAIAVADGFNAEGGTRNFNFASRASHADLYKWIRLGRGVRGKRRSDGFFFRAESFYNVSTEIEKLGLVSGTSPYGDVSYHDQSSRVRDNVPRGFGLQPLRGAFHAGYSNADLRRCMVLPRSQTSSAITHGLRYSPLKSSSARGLSTNLPLAGSMTSFSPPRRRLMLA